MNNPASSERERVSENLNWRPEEPNGQLADWAERIHVIKAEMEEFYGDPPLGAYPPRHMMLAHCLWSEIYRAAKANREVTDVES
jgi:hypothetical protein